MKPLSIHRWDDLQEDLAALSVPVDTYDGSRIHTSPLDPSRCQRVKISIHPLFRGELIRLQCYCDEGHAEGSHHYSSPDNRKRKQRKEN